MSQNALAEKGLGCSYLGKLRAVTGAIARFNVLFIILPPRVVPAVSVLMLLRRLATNTV